MSQQMNENIECVIRLGHCSGHTDSTFIEQNKLMTCGVDSEVRIWPINDNQIEDYIDCLPISDLSYAIVSNSTHFFIACDSNCVKSYSLSDGENETTVCRFQTNATHLDISSDGQLLVASAADFTIKVINLVNKDQKCFEGHVAPILSVALDPKLQYMASSSCDSSVRIWNIQNQNCVQFWTNCFPKSNDFDNSQTLSRICWQPIDGQVIAVPKLDRIDIYERESWQLIKTYKHEKLSQTSIVSFSFDAKYLAVASNEGIVMIWETDSSNDKPIAQFFRKTKRITSLKWNPKSSKQLSFCDIGGQFGVLFVKNISETNDKELDLSQNQINDMFADITDDFEETEDIQNNDINTEKDLELEKIEFNPKYRQEIVKHDQNVEITSNDNVVEETNDENDLEFDIGAIKSRYESQIIGQTNDSAKDKTVDSRSPSRHEENEEQSEELPPLRQEPFQSGSTPIHLENRFMVWNSVGIVRSSNTEDENSIDVEFHDTTYHHSIHLPNTQNYSISDLSNEAFILATSSDQSYTNGKLFCMLLNIWDSTKDWQIEMPKEELIEAIACGSNFIGVATDKRFIRIFTLGGIQTNVISIAGRVVCLSAFEHFLMIIYHSGSGMPEEQSLSMFVLNVEHKSNVKHPVPDSTPVALSPKSLVSWAGFTDEGTPCIVDYDGVIRLFTNNFGNTWIPITSTKEQANGKSNNFFVVGLSEIQSQIRCIFCKGSRYPSTIPKPTLTLLPFRIPLCEINTTKGKHEEEHIRSKILSKLLEKLSKSGFDVDSSIEECTKSLIASTIKLFAMALGANRESMAVEIFDLMPNKIAVEGAIKYAERQKHRTLAQKLYEIANKKTEELSESEEEEGIQEFGTTTKMSLNLRTDIMKNSVELKPKPMKRSDEDSNSRFNSDKSDSESDTNQRQNEDINDEDSNSVTLKPKPIHLTKQSNGNPFKVTQRESKLENRRKRDRNSDESDDEESNSVGFQRFYSEMKQIIRDDNSDVEDEEELKEIAMRQFKELDSEERKGWAKSDIKNKKRKTKTDDKHILNKKITKFFTRN